MIYLSALRTYWNEHGTFNSKDSPSEEIPTRYVIVSQHVLQT